MLRSLILTLCIICALIVSFTPGQAAEQPTPTEITSSPPVPTPDAPSTEAAVQRPTVTFDRAIHFIAGEGSDVQLLPGTYGVEQAGQGHLRLVPGDNQAPIEMQATSIAHDELLPAPVSMAVIEEGQDDTLHLVLLLPSGQGLDATGSFSGTRSRAAVSALGSMQIQTAVAQSKVTSAKSLYLTVPMIPAAGKTAPPPAAAVTATPLATESVETSGPGKRVTWNYLAMHHPEIVAQALADVQTNKQPRTSVAGLASQVELNDMLKINWSAEVAKNNAAQKDVTTRGGVVIPYESKISASGAYAAALWASGAGIALPVRHLGSVWAGQRATAVVSLTAPADGYVEGRFNLNATNRHFRIVNAIAYSGEVIGGKSVVSLTVPGGQYQDVVPDPANPPAQISKAGFVAILAKKGQRIDFTVAFEPVGLGMTPVGDNEATLQLSGATSSEINILSNAPATTWMRTASIRARFEGINFGVLGAIDNTAITQFDDGTPCPRLVPVPASITFFNAEQQVRTVSVSGESLAPNLFVQPFTVTVPPGQSKQVAIPLQRTNCMIDGAEYFGTIKYSYPGVERRAQFGVTVYPNVHHWSKESHVGYCQYTWAVFAHSDGTTFFVYSLRNTHLILPMRLNFQFVVLNKEIGQAVLNDGPGPHIERNSHTALRDPIMRDNYARFFSEPLQARLRCHKP
jgi:hypothetical protein